MQILHEKHFIALIRSPELGKEFLDIVPMIRDSWLLQNENNFYTSKDTSKFSPR